MLQAIFGNTPTLVPTLVPASTNPATLWQGLDKKTGFSSTPVTTGTFKELWDLGGKLRKQKPYKGYKFEVIANSGEDADEKPCQLLAISGSGRAFRKLPKVASALREAKTQKLRDLALAIGILIVIGLVMKHLGL